MNSYGRHPGRKVSDSAPFPLPTTTTTTSTSSAATGRATTAEAEALLVDADGTWPLDTSDGGPCRTWPVLPGCSSLPADPADWTATDRNAIALSTSLLWHATAGQYGLCRQVLRPCLTPPAPAGLSSRLGRSAVGSRFSADACGCGSRACSCAQELQLPGPVYYAINTDPVHDIEVWIDGEQLLDGWRLYSGGVLVRTDGGDWPTTQDLRRPVHAPQDDPSAAYGAWGVIYWRGRPVPPGGRRANALLSDEIRKACDEDSTCRLPPRLVEMVQRQGVTYRMVDKREFLGDGLTGVTEIDLWISSVNRSHARSAPQVYTVDGPQHYAEPISSAYPEGVQ
jgi:hypothetical protein